MTYSLQRHLAWQIKAQYGGDRGKLLFQVAYIVIIRYDLPISLNTMLPAAKTASLHNQLTNH
jgi:hypothetical protein